MFEEVIIDFSGNSYDSEGKFHNSKETPKEYRLYPFLYLIAGQVKQAGMGNGIPLDRGGSFEFVQEVEHVWTGRPHMLDMAKNDEGVLFTPNKIWKAEYLRYEGLSMESAALLLAAAGLEITIPGFTFDLAKKEEVMKLRNSLAEERERYIASIINLANETFERLSSGVYSDTVDWALNEAFVNIKPKAIEFELAMSKLDRSLLKRVQYNLVSEGVPAIGSALVNKGFIEASKMSVVKLLEVLSTNLVRNIEERQVPEVVYGYKINKFIAKES